MYLFFSIKFECYFSCHNKILIKLPTVKVIFSMFKPIILLLHIICYCNMLHCKSVKEQTYSDMIKNITLANKILQDLIKNYERLEKIYKSEELLQMHSTSTETDQTFKSMSVNKSKTKQRARSNKKYTSKPFKGTAIIYESLSDEKVVEEFSEETKEVEKDRRPVQSKVKNFKGKTFSNEDFTARFNILNKKSIPNTSVGKSEARSKESSEDRDSEDLEQIIIEIPKEVNGVVLNTPNERIIKSDLGNKPITNIWGSKTRFSIQHTVNRKDKTNLSKNETLVKGALRSGNDTKTLKKIIRAQIISPNKIKQKKILSKPRLRKLTEGISQTKNKLKSNNKEKITLLILTNKENGNYGWNKKFKTSKLKNEQGFPSTDLLNDILRSGYGDTCLQMPIKKCKKALKTVNKNICKRRFKCKSDFKSDFIQNSKDGCNEEFAYREKHIENNETKSEKIETFSPPEFRELKKSYNNDRREKKGSVKALPKYKLQQLDRFRSLRNETPLSAFLRRKRDRYEKKCQKESTIKCNNACSYALKETCGIHTCEKKKKKAIKSECKTQCKIAYEDTKQKVKSSSNSDSEGESESDSEMESESD